MRERDEAHTGRLRARRAAARPVRGDGHVEVFGERRQQRARHRSAPPRLGERDEDEEPWTHRETASDWSAGRERATGPETYDACGTRAKRIARDAGDEAYDDRMSRAGALPFGLVAIGILLWWAAAEGGYAPSVVVPGRAAVPRALRGRCREQGERRGRPPPRAWPAIALLAAFTVWSFLSIAWAGARGDAWDGANRTLLYLDGLRALRPAAVEARQKLLVLLGALRARHGGRSVGSTLATRRRRGTSTGTAWPRPIGYENASAALLLIAFWPARLFLAARPELDCAARGLLLAVGGALLELALAGSEPAARSGVAVGVPCAHPPQPGAHSRTWGAPPCVAVASLVTLEPLLEVVAASGEREVEHTVARASVGSRPFERRAARGWRAARVPRAAAVVACGAPGAFTPRRRAVAILAAGVLVVVCGGRRRGSNAPRPGLESGRYDMWRVAAAEFAHHPLLGVGVDNFAVGYVRERAADSHLSTRTAFSSEPFSQTVSSAARSSLASSPPRSPPRSPDADTRARWRPRSRRAASRQASTGSRTGSIDWLWEIPVLGASGCRPARAGFRPRAEWSSRADPGGSAGAGRRGRRGSAPSLSLPTRSRVLQQSSSSAP